MEGVIHLERVVTAPLDPVWRAFTEPDEAVIVEFSEATGSTRVDYRHPGVAGKPLGWR